MLVIGGVRSARRPGTELWHVRAHLLTLRACLDVALGHPVWYLALWSRSTEKAAAMKGRGFSRVPGLLVSLMLPGYAVLGDEPNRSGVGERGTNEPVEPAEPVSASASFPAPPDSTKEMTVVNPKFPPFPNILVAR